MLNRSTPRTDPVVTTLPLDDLVAQISSSTAILSKFLKDNGHQQPSLSADSPAFFPPAPSEVQAARNKLISSARELSIIAQWPLDGSLTLSWEPFNGAALHFISHYNIADYVPLSSSITFTDLANNLGVPQQSHQRMIRLLRHAMTNYIFREPSLGYIAHTALSSALRRNSPTPAARAIVANRMENYLQSIPYYVEAIERHGHEEETRENAPGSLACSKPLMEWLAERPHNLALLNGAMKEVSEAPVADVKHFVQGYDWNIIDDGILVDVGGGTGPVSRAIATAYPKIQIIVQDRLSAVQEGRQCCPRSISSRFTWQTHDFFQPNPVHNADVYFMRWILHDWPDHSSAQILKNIAVSMGTTSRIIVADIVVPDPGTMDAAIERSIRHMDIMMMSMNGIERSMEQWQALIERVGMGLKINRVIKPVESLLSLIEIVKL